LKIRRPVQAGSFYSGTAESLKKQIEECFQHKLGPGKNPTVQKGPRNIVGLVCPHAGYMYSGPVAAHSYYNLAIDGKPDTVVIFGPNHTGEGSGLAVVKEGAWRTPLGDVQIDEAVAHEILRKSKIIDVDDSAHAHEHSIEVQLPFLQYLYNAAFKFVPICCCRSPEREERGDHRFYGHDPLRASRKGRREGQESTRFLGKPG